MNDTTNRDPAAASETGEPIRVSEGGLAVEKELASRGDEAVVVRLTVRSEREEQSLVRLVDQLPSALDDPVVEFHPGYDPEHWTAADGRLVYESMLDSGGVRTTVYGVAVEDRTQRELFRTPPSVESVVLGDPDGEARLGSARSGAATDLARADGADGADGAEGPDDPDADDPAPFTFGDEPAADGASALAEGWAGSDATPRPEPPADESVVEALVRELERRELTPSERAAIRGAVAIDETPSVERLESRLYDLTADIGSVAADIDRLTADVVDLSGTVDDLDEAIEQERRWRDDLRRLLSAEADDDS